MSFLRVYNMDNFRNMGGEAGVARGKGKGREKRLGRGEKGGGKRREERRWGKRREGGGVEDKEGGKGPEVKLLANYLF